MFLQYVRTLINIDFQEHLEKTNLENFQEYLEKTNLDMSNLTHSHLDEIKVKLEVNATIAITATRTSRDMGHYPKKNFNT